jgi:RimJ/RimL family protein N-acetyltransferase
MTTAGSGLHLMYPIRTERLELRPHRLADVDDLLAFHSRPDVVRFIPWPVRDRAQTATALELKLGQGELTEPGQWLVLAVELRQTRTVIGEVLLKWVSDTDRLGELGFAFHSDFHGLGLAAEAATAMMRLGFEDLGLHRIEARCLVDNVSSARLLERLGMRWQGRFVHGVWFKGEWADQLVYSVIEDEWRGLTPGAADDRTAIATVVETFFAAFTSGSGCDERLDALRASFITEAVIVRACGQPPDVYDVDGFISPRRELLTNGTLTEFREWPVSGHTELFGDIAHHFCTTPRREYRTASRSPEPEPRVCSSCGRRPVGGSVPWPGTTNPAREGQIIKGHSPRRRRRAIHGATRRTPHRKMPFDRELSRLFLSRRFGQKASAGRYCRTRQTSRGSSDTRWS